MQYLIQSWKKIRSGKILDDVNSEYDLVHMISGGVWLGAPIKFLQRIHTKKLF